MLPQEIIERIKQEAQSSREKYGHIYAVRIGDRVKIGFSKRDPKGRIAQHKSLCSKLGANEKKHWEFISEFHYGAREHETDILRFCRMNYEGNIFGSEWFTVYDDAPLLKFLNEGIDYSRKPTEKEIENEFEKSKQFQMFLRHGLSTETNDVPAMRKNGVIANMLVDAVDCRFGDSSFPDGIDEDVQEYIHFALTSGAKVIGDALEESAHWFLVYNTLDMIDRAFWGSSIVQYTINTTHHAAMTNILFNVRKYYSGEWQKDAVYIAEMFFFTLAAVSAMMS